MSSLESLNTHNFHHVLEEVSGVSLVFFTHTLCSSCRAWKQLLQTYSASHPAIRIFEVDAETEMALTNEFEVFHLPALFLYKDGRYHAPLQSMASLEAIDQAITHLFSKPAEELP